MLLQVQSFMEKHPKKWSMCEDGFQVFCYENIDYNDVLVAPQQKGLSDVLMFR